MEKIEHIKYIVIDVDGTMTDGGIYYDEHGNEQKKFCTKDAVGFFVLHELGVKIIVLTGRKCEATKRRMNELKVDYLFQNVKDKYKFLKEFIAENEIRECELGYIGDDLNDLKSMSLASFVGCPIDACDEIKSIADVISDFNGGYGAVRNIVEKMYSNDNTWSDIINKLYLENIV